MNYITIKRAEIIELYNEGVKVKELAKRYDISISAMYNQLAKLQREGAIKRVRKPSIQLVD